MSPELAADFTKVAVWFACLIGTVVVARSADSGDNLVWEQLPPIPDAEGFAGAFAGVSHGALIVAGGANIAGEKWGETFQKQWHDSIFVLGKPDGKWKSGFKLPRALGYGVSVTTERGVVCIGGSGAERHHAEVFLIEWRDGRIVISPMPELPGPCANACGALVGQVIYVAGGLATPTDTQAMKSFWQLDLAATERKWESLEPWPGPERMLAVAGALGNSFFLFSGARLVAGIDGKPVREYLRDAYRFTPAEGWKRLADLPRAAVAAPSPALASEDALRIVSGDDGLNVTFQPIKEHPGFPRDVLVYDAKRDAWRTGGEAPFSRATAPTVRWLGREVIPNGEVRPRLRTPEVWVGRVR